MREYDETSSTREFWTRREEEIRADIEAAREYAASDEGKKEEARIESNYQAWLGPQKTEPGPGLNENIKALFAKYQNGGGK